MNWILEFACLNNVNRLVHSKLSFHLSHPFLYLISSSTLISSCTFPLHTSSALKHCLIHQFLFTQLLPSKFCLKMSPSQIKSVSPFLRGWSSLISHLSPLRALDFLSSLLFLLFVDPSSLLLFILAHSSLTHTQNHAHERYH